MPQSATPKLGLYRALADGSENFSLVNDLLNNWDKIDAAMGATAVTSSTRPASAFNGQVIRETDTGRVYISNGTLPGSASFTTQAFVYGVRTVSGSAAQRAIKLGFSQDSVDDRYFVQNDGTTWWGSGSATVDTNLYRAGANVLKTDDSLQVGGDLTVSGIGQKTFLLTTTDRVITSNTTLAGDTELTASLAANAKYIITVRAVVAGTTGDFQTSWTMPASATGVKFCTGPALASTNRADTTMRASAHAFSSAVNYGLNDSVNGVVVEEIGYVSTVSAGSWFWNRAQNTSSASATTVQAPSVAIIERVA